MLGKRKEKTESFDRKAKRPAVRCSICTGEQVAGFQDLQTGRFEEITVLLGPEDREAFMKKYGIREEELTKIW